MFYKNPSQEYYARLPYVPVTIGEFEHQRREERPDGLLLYQFIWVLEGCGTFHAGERCETLCAGSGMFTRATTPHGYCAAGDIFTTMWVTFFSVGSLIDYYHIQDSFFFDLPDFLTRDTRALAQTCHNVTSEMVRSACGYSWLGNFFHRIKEQDDTPMQRVMRYLNTHYSQQLSLEMIAEHAGISRFALCRNFREVFGETVGEALRRIRMDRAKELLLRTEFSCEQVGEACGYGDAGYFTKLFRESVGVPPGEYRRNR